MLNSGGAEVGPRGYVQCRKCGKEETGISRETSAEYAYCLDHRLLGRETIQPKGEIAMSEKKDKNARAGSTVPIKWFQEQSQQTQDVDTIRTAAQGEGYSKSTISIQIGRLRAAGFLPAAEKKERVKKEKTEKVASIRSVPKPSKRKKAA